MSGYRISENCKDWFSHFWSESFGQIYPTLKKLLASGDIVKCPAEPGQRGDVFAITKTGQETLRAWLETPAAPASKRDEFYLKFFSADAVSETAQRELLLQKRRNLEALIADARSSLAHLEVIDLPNSEHWILMVQAGLLTYEAELIWCNKAEKMINNRHKKGRG